MTRAVEIGNPRGRIALYLDYEDAVDMALHFGPNDSAYGELMQAVKRAYPHGKPKRIRGGPTLRAEAPFRISGRA